MASMGEMIRLATHHSRDAGGANGDAKQVSSDTT
jgi:hypothetical protein